jgi:hypothetical protein
MSQLAYRTALIAVLAAAVIVTAISTARAGESATVAGGDVAPYTTPRTGVLTNSGVTGRAMIVTPAGAHHSIVRMHADGLAPGQEYGVHVHFGACLAYQGHFQYQVPGAFTRDNEAWLDLIANSAGQARDQVKVPRIDVDARALSIVIHARANPDRAPGQPGSRIACADLNPHA